MRVFITGGSGLLALNWAKARSDTDEIILGLHQRQIKPDGVETITVKIEDDDEFSDAIGRIAPDVIIHTAAITDVDHCERDPDQAMHVNRDLASKVARASYHHGCRLIHISTDHLFQGNKAMLDETATCQPVNVYGQSKWQAELAVTDQHPGALILRVNFFGWGPPWRPSFSDWILSNIKAENPITLYQDVFFTPLYIGDLVKAVHVLLDKELSGIYHVTSGERISKFDFGMKLVRDFGLDANLIRAGKYQTQKRIPRPLDLSLSNAKLLKATGIDPFTIDASIARLKADHKLAAYFSSLDYPQ